MYRGERLVGHQEKIGCRSLVAFPGLIMEAYLIGEYTADSFSALVD